MITRKITGTILITCLGLMFLLICGCSPSSSEINWYEGSFEEIQVEALRTKRDMLVFLYADWCGYCSYMKENVLVDSEVIDYVQSQFLPYKAPDTSGDSAVISGFYRSHSYPTFLILEPDGTEIERIVGKRETEEFLNILKIAHTGKFTLEYYLDKLVNTPEDPVLLTRIFTKYVERKDSANALRYLRRIEASAPEYYEQNRGCLMGTLSRAEQ